ncbi:hypothetical protein FRC03_008366, partial [Tulasnella sp. 419]
ASLTTASIVRENDSGAESLTINRLCTTFKLCSPSHHPQSPSTSASPCLFFLSNEVVLSSSQNRTTDKSIVTLTTSRP